MEPVGIGVVGCGYWGPNLIRNFNEVSVSRVVAVGDLMPERLDRILARYPEIHATTDYRELLNNPAVDAIVIATPVWTHFDLAIQALEHGKHVLVEKPLAATSGQVSRLMDEATDRQRVLMVDHTFVYTEAVRAIRDLVRSDSLGEIYYYDSVRVNLGLFQNDHSVVWDLAVHDLAIMDYILPLRPRAISATGAGHVNGQPENIAYLTLFFEGNLIAHVHVNWLAPVKMRRTLIGGSRKMIVYDDMEPSEKVKIYDKGVTVTPDAETLRRMLIGYRLGDMWAPHLGATEALQTEALHFVDCITKGHIPLTDGQAGLRVVRMLEAATQSMAVRGAPIDLPADEASP